MNSLQQTMHIARKLNRTDRGLLRRYRKGRLLQFAQRLLEAEDAPKFTRQSRQLEDEV